MRKILSIVLILVAAACSSVPMTGRNQLSLISNDELMALSTDEYKKVLDSADVVTTGHYADMVKTVGVRIQASVEKYMADNGYSDRLEGFDWEFNLIKDDAMVNAWAMPGGKVAFYTGIMPLCQDEVGVAVVMGHEIAHAIASHGAERMSQGLALQLGVGTVQAAMGEDPSTTQQIFLQSLGISSQLGILAYSRKHESEADKIGLVFMAMAGYDPREAPIFWERMSSNSAGQPPEWLSTHPSHERRIAELNEHMPEALKYYQE
jgi:predicted Zn-dependent protease